MRSALYSFTSAANWRSSLTVVVAFVCISLPWVIVFARAVLPIKYLLFLLIGGPILCLIIKYPIVGVYGFVFNFWIEKVLTFEIAGLTPNRLLGLATLLSILVRIVILKKSFYFSRLVILLVAYLVVATVSMLLSGRFSDASIAYIQSVVGGLLLYLLVTNAIEEPRQLRSLYLIIIIASTILAVSGLQELFRGRILLRYKSPLAGGVGSLGLYSLWGLPFTLYYLRTAQSYLWKTLCLGVFILLSAAVIISGYRTGMIGLGLMVLMLINRKAIGRSFAILVVVAIVLWLIVSQLSVMAPLVTKRMLFRSGIDEGSLSRIDSALKSVAMFADHLFFGVGFGDNRQAAPLSWIHGNFVYQDAGYADHNLYSNTLAEMGLVGILSLLGILLYAFRILIRSRSTLFGNVKNMLAPITMLFVFYCLLEAMFHLMYLRRDFFLVFALVTVIERVARNRGKNKS